ncbi:hypothetical protein B0H14DRAFT_3502765 [Mycena olivaceomarginata]|nr:hypothetical protein B0H14DRAFT_3502765 [Mycena olivaceomarginata]
MQLRRRLSPTAAWHSSRSAPTNSSTTTTSLAPETAVGSVTPAAASLAAALWSEKHNVVLALFRSVDIPEWTAVVNTWGALEKAVSEKTPVVLSTRGRPAAVGWWVQRGRKDGRIPANLSSDDEKEDFYEGVMKWWLEVNPAWRKEGLANASAPDFAVQGLKQEAGGDLGSLPPGLNRLTRAAPVVPL